MKRQYSVLGLLLLSVVGIAQGAAVVEDSLRQDEARRVAIHYTHELKVILETDQFEPVSLGEVTKDTADAVFDGVIPSGLAGLADNGAIL